MSVTVQCAWSYLFRTSILLSIAWVLFENLNFLVCDNGSRNSGIAIITRWWWHLPNVLASAFALVQSVALL